MSERWALVRKRAEAASPCWKMRHRHAGRGPGDDEADGLGWDFDEDAGSTPPVPMRGVLSRAADAAFVENARQDLLDALAEIERLEGIVADLSFTASFGMGDGPEGTADDQEVDE